MPFQQVPNTMQVTVRFLLFNQIVENVYDVNSPDGIDAAVLADCRDAFIDWVTTQYMPSISHDCFFTGLELQNLSIENGSILSYTAPTPVAGGANAASEPGNVSFCVSLRTGSSGRSFRGRKYVAGVPVVFRAGNQVTADWAADILAAMNGLISVLSAINQVLVVVSRIQNGIELVTAQTTAVSNVTYTNLDIDSQRRRLTGRGK